MKNTINSYLDVPLGFLLWKAEEVAIIIWLFLEGLTTDPLSEAPCISSYPTNDLAIFLTEPNEIAVFIGSTFLLL
jgi:hypothetical protein